MSCQTCVRRPGYAQDSFYRTLTPEEQELASKNEYNFDVPSALDRKEILSCLQRLKEGRSVDVPIYDFATHRRSTETRRVSPGPCVQHHIQPATRSSLDPLDTRMEPQLPPSIAHAGAWKSVAP